MQREFYKKKLANGLTVLFEKRNLPVINSALAFRVGYGYEPAKYKGLTHYIEHCVFQGSEKKDSKQISKIIEGRGGILNAFTADEVTVFWNKLPARYLNISIGILSEILSKPAFKKEKIEKEKRVVLEEAKMYHDSPDQYVPEKLKSLLYKEPFGMEAVGTEKTILPLKREDVLRFFNLYNNPILSVVGRADFEEILALAMKIPVTKRPALSLKAEKINRHLVEARKGLVQSHFALGFHTFTLKDRRRYALESFNTILAGGMSSRLFQEIRDKRGMAYVVKGYPEIGTEFGYNLFYAGTEKKHIKAVKEIILKEIKKMQHLDRRDFEDSKERLIGRYELFRESSHEVMMALIEDELAGNAEEFYHYEDRINALKLREVRALGKLKNYSSMVLVPK